MIGLFLVIGRFYDNSILLGTKTKGLLQNLQFFHKVPRYRIHAHTNTLRYFLKNYVVKYQNSIFAM